MVARSNCGVTASVMAATLFTRFTSGLLLFTEAVAVRGPVPGAKNVTPKVAEAPAAKLVSVGNTTKPVVTA